jgi:ParB-like chromosome segregation protein Spo0J
MPDNSGRRALKIQDIEVDRLHLDPDNPRLSDIGTKRTDDEILKTLWDEMAVSEVALSIAANGYFEEEPLFVIPKPPRVTDPQKQHYTVVEGNRRLAAVKLLRDPQLRRLVKATELEKISSKLKESLVTLPVSIYPDKKSLWEYFGFRHVNGPKEWDSFSKAAYIAEVRRKYEISLDEIARKIGDQHSTVTRIYRGYVLLEQAEKMTSFRREDRIANRFHFSHLYTAADQKEFQSYLGIDPDRSLKDSPVSKSHLPQLGELMVWLFGSRSEGKSPVVEKQNPHLRYLRLALGNRQALYALRSGISLQRAYEISLGDDRRFQEALVRAKDAMQEAKATVTTGYKGEKDMLKVMDGLLDLANSISKEMRQKAQS